MFNDSKNEIKISEDFWIYLVKRNLKLVSSHLDRNKLNIPFIFRLWVETYFFIEQQQQKHTLLKKKNTCTVSSTRFFMF